MPLTMTAARGHAEIPSNDGWFHCTLTGAARMTLQGSFDQIAAVRQDLVDRGLIGDQRIANFHDGPGEQSCAACRTATTA